VKGVVGMKAPKKKVLRPPGGGEGQRQRRKHPKERPAWLLPVLALLVALAVVALALYASSQKGR
jgi:paraquat-inducible protein B